MTEDTDYWVFEGPDPSVGIFGTLILHACPANVEETEAEQGEVKQVHDGRFIHTITSWVCGPCGAETMQHESEPYDESEEGGSDDRAAEPR